ncbi:MAG: SpoIIE family protein phosphatase [Candidatus Krumholzibacteria bacterium]|nr:SpoIIE family protein phosphatase [Candidatus Krumholzibacteria bacterium]
MGASSFLASFYLVCGIIIFILAVTILRQSGKSTVSWFTALVLFFASFGPILGAISYILENNPREGTVLFKDLVGSFDYVWEFFFPSLVLFALVYPRRNRAWPWLRKFAWMLFLPHLFHLILVIFLIHRVNPARMFRALAEFPVSIRAASAFFERAASHLNVLMDLLFKAHVQLFSIVNIAYGGFAMILLVNSLRSDLAPRVKRQVVVLIGGIGLCLVTFSLARVFPSFARMEERRYVFTALINASLIIGGGSIAFAIVRYQFLDMKLIGRKGVLYVAAAAIFASIYLLIVKQITNAFSQFSGGRVEILETGFIILFIIAFQPVLARLEDWSERFLVRERHDPRSRIRALSGELLTMIDVSAMNARIGSVLREVFEAEEAKLVLVGEVLEQSGGDPDVSKVIEALRSVGEPLSRADLLESLGYLSSKNNIFRRGGRKHAAAIMSSLPRGVREFAVYELLVPVAHEGECVAAILLGPRRELVRYSAEEQALLSMLASQVSSSLHNMALLKEVVEKRVLEEELNIARSIQLNLLPSKPPQLERYEVSALSVSSKQVGGDYYDYLHRGSLLAVAVADISGKGVPASLLMASLQASLRSNMDRMERPVELVGRLNTMMCETTTEDKFATLFYGCLDMERNTLGYTNAGHVFPVIVRAGGEVEVLDYSGLILGVLPGFEYELKSLRFDPGDVLVVTSDGVTEATNAAGEFFGEARLRELLASIDGRCADEVRDSIIERINCFSGPKGAGDDLTILVLRRKK